MLADLPYEGHGALIAPSWVVTAAHAVQYMQDHPNERFVTIGGNGSFDDVRAVRSGTFRQGVCGQTFASTRLSFFAGWIAETMRTTD